LVVCVCLLVCGVCVWCVCVCGGGGGWLEVHVNFQLKNLPQLCDMIKRTFN